jgi:hypothetical protein
MGSSHQTQPAANLMIACHPTCNGKASESGLFQGCRRLDCQNIRHGMLDTGTDVGQNLILVSDGFRSPQLLNKGEDGSLETTERKAQISTAAKRSGQLILVGPTELCSLFQGRSSRKSQMKKLGNFVKAFPRCVIDGGSQQSKGSPIIHCNKTGVSSTHHKSQVREFLTSPFLTGKSFAAGGLESDLWLRQSFLIQEEGWTSSFQSHREQVGCHVMNPNNRELPSEG